MTQPLAGVRVLELATGIAGPYAGKLFGDYGADVIKVEPPDGDVARRWGPFLDGLPDRETSALFLHLNTNKRSITLDLECESGRDLLRRIIPTVDICVESFAPGTLARWGVDVPTLQALNRELVVTSITPFGQSGPYQAYLGSEVVYSAMGTMNFTRTDDGRPVTLGGNLCQYQAGNLAAAATMAGLLSAESGDEGTHIDISIAAAQAASANSTMVFLTAHAYNGRTSTPAKQVAAKQTGLGPYPNGTFRCSDGAVMVSTLHVWAARMVATVDDPELTEIFRDPNRLTESGIAERINAIVARWCSARTKRQAMAEAQSAGWPVTAIQSPADLADDPHFTERGSIVDVAHPIAGSVTQLGAPFRLEDGWRLRRPAPCLGEHNAEVYGELGFAATELTAYRAAGVI